MTAKMLVLGIGIHFTGKTIDKKCRKLASVGSKIQTGFRVLAYFHF